jgi:Cu/Ag efflux protein CusF
MKMKIAASLLVTAAVWYAAKAAQQPAFKGGSVAVAQVETVVKIEKVDRSGKTVTIKDPEGKRIKIEIPPDVSSLKDVKAGMPLRLRYLQSEAVALGQPGMPPMAQQASMRLVPKNGSGEVMAHVREMTGTIQDLDLQNRKLTLKHPNGKTHTLPVADNVEGLENAKIGDTVLLRYTEAVALEAAKPK